MEFQQQNPNSIRKSGNVQVESSSIQLIYLHLPSPSQLPPHHHTTRSLPPHLFPFLIPAFDAAKPNFSNILSTLKPNLVIYDFLQPWAAAAANEQDVESVMFLTTGADGISSAVHYFKNPNVEHSIQEAELKKYILQWFGGTENGVRNKDRFLECLERSSNMTVPVGPLVQECGNRKEDVHIMEWLGKKEPGSVVLVSFGSDLFISKEDMEEIAMGLELSKICFIWAVRFQGGYNMFYWKAFQRDLRRGV
ncbi:flavanone 7-O-glucoside 2''-O-beta-L-rhamnosyltransferase-like [Gossypium arboreum]|uniref:flavanone 7-O-glucoside 2''-O-beta-L-rhamnosyltransferase-like n=1 Tax=Gossypium arboreum TaxID=29729 RepID=UPI0022F14C3B|nr:flavanone 7-O-glucoside 2''-O-beta-L-rhamnosyltransferase-like [Gossypium arboreum]